MKREKGCTLSLSFDVDPTPFSQRALDPLLETTCKMDTIQELLQR
jgi:hypothetical protein